MRSQELQRSHMATVRALSNAVEARDAYTAKHAERVTAYGLMIARGGVSARSPADRLLACSERVRSLVSRTITSSRSRSRSVNRPERRRPPRLYHGPGELPSRDGIALGYVIGVPAR